RLDPSDALWKCRNSLADPLNPGYGSFVKLTALDDPTGEAAFLEFARRLHALDGEEHRAWILENIDVEALIDYQAVKSVISDQDGFTKNWMLFHGTSKDARGKTVHRWTAHPWDLDLSFGQIELGSDELVTESHPLTGTIDHPRHGRTGTSWNGLLEAVFGRRSGDYFIKALYGRIWSILEEKFHPQALGAKLLCIDAHTAEAAAADLERWPRWGLEPTNATFHRERLRRYCRERHAFLRRFLTSEHPTTASEVDPRPRSEFPDFDGRVFAPPARAWRSFRYTPAPRLKITEVHYHPGDDEALEFIEIRNLEASAVDISGWDLPAVGYVFPKGSEAPGGEVLVVARDPERLKARHPRLGKTRLFGPYAGRLGNSGEELRLRDGGFHQGERCFPETIDVVKYGDAPPWPREPDGGGPSLELRSAALDNDLPESWRASAEAGGTPGA
ncbi:MAG: CotH kinase family protein, partial [Thermoanaerobaculia bacterium]